ncbi:MULTISPECIES: YcdB/YcdC domain-containing protein [Methanoculleus]|uniref:YcdB/YcdC repeated domain-containing protein n=1 Tax=Methanoculleus thermophilus TaxID=2200 RepID=A0A1G8X335_9EURY|nr:MULTISPECIES: YcdB/YcdC domain-containing protein [Methanoculleus]SDJ85012.1 hypothetical protein SAMN04488571_101229 [Methanoculleus thermophilus]
MTNKLTGILLILCITGVLIVAGVWFSVTAADPLPPEPPLSPTPGTTPTGDGITEAEAKTIAAAALPDIVRAETARVRLERGLFDVSDSNATRQAQVRVDARTGEITGFVVHVPALAGRPAEPVLTMEETYGIAEEFLADRGETADLAAAVGKYYTPHKNERTGETVAGYYGVALHRSIRGIPCAWNGCWIDVDAVTGEIRRYDRFWDLDAARCTADTEPAITAEEAEESARGYIQDTYGELSGLTFRSATLVWADNSAPATGEVPLAWKVSFDDDYYRSLGTLLTAAVFVDARTGEVLSCDYYRRPGAA